MNPSHSGVTVIIPTTAQAARAAAIRRCVESIRRSSVAPVAIIAVVNGARSDAQVCAWLKAQPDVRYEYSALGSAPHAVLHGRRLVTTDYFATLDDDDELLAGGTDAKLAPLVAAPAADLVVSNTLRVNAEACETWYSGLPQVRADPLAAMFHETWLNSGNALYRSASIGVDYFIDPMPFLEWTWLAFRLGMDRKRVLVLEAAANQINVTPNSLSQSDAYFESYFALFDRMLACQPPAAVVRLIKRRMSAHWHDYSSRALGQGRWRMALAGHLRSLALPGGLRYLSYSRHLLKASRPA